MANQERITQIWSEIAQWEAQKESGVSMQTAEQIDRDIKTAKKEISRLEAEDQAAEKSQREQGKQEIVGTYVETLSLMFEALLPSETFRPLFGINAYEEKRAQFYQLNQALTGETIDQQHQKNEELLAAKDEVIKSVKTNSLEISEQLDISRKEVFSWSEQYDALQFDYVNLEERYTGLEKRVKEANDQVMKIASERDDAIEKFNKAHQLTVELNEKLVDAESKIVAAQQPKEEVKPSAKVNDVINQIKSQSQLTPNDWLSKFNARQKDESAKLEVPELPQQESPSTIANEAESNGDQLPPTHEAAAVTFPKPDQVTTVTPPSIGLQLATQSSNMEGSGESAEETATKGWVKEQIAKALAEIQGEQVAS